MFFCDKCGTLMTPNDEGKMVCSSCGFTPEAGSKQIMSEKFNKNNDVAIVDEKQDDDTLPTTKAQCPECGNSTAYYWFIQTRAADEAPTRFLRCTKCKHTWREYD